MIPYSNFMLDVVHCLRSIYHLIHETFR